MKKRIEEIVQEEKKGIYEPSSQLEKISLLNRVHYVDGVLAKFRQPAKNVAKDVWINGMSKKKASIRNNVSESGVYYLVNYELDRVFGKDCT